MKNTTAIKKLGTVTSNYVPHGFNVLVMICSLFIGSAAFAQDFSPTLDDLNVKEYLKTLTYDHDNDATTAEIRVISDADVDALSSSYIVETNDETGESSILFKARDYDGLTVTTTYAGIDDLVVDYITKHKSSITDNTASTYYERIENVTPSDGSEPASGNYTFSITDPTDSTNTFYFAVKDTGGSVVESTNNFTDTVSGDINENFIGSNVNAYGGAIDNEGSNNSITGDFIGNRADFGGAIYNRGSMTSIIGDFIGNSAAINAGAIYNDDRSTIENITGDFIGNRTASAGGAIVNVGSITSMVGNFIGNSSSNNSGGAIANIQEGNIGTIIGDFIANSAGSAGGAIANSGSITSLVGDFIGNSAEYDGGAIFNTGSITSLVGDFIGNSASIGGAISNWGSINSITGNFIGNSARNIGGAIYTTNDLTFLANGTEKNTFSGNYTIHDDGGTTKDYNAIFVDGDDKTLTFDMQGDGGFTMDDNIDGSGAYSVDITGEDATKNIFQLNNALRNASNVNIENTTLAFGSVIHDGTTYSGSLVFSNVHINGASIIKNANLQYNNTTINNGANATFVGDTFLGSVVNNGSFTLQGEGILNQNYSGTGSLTVASGGALKVNNGTLDVSGGMLTVNSNAEDFTIGEQGSLIAQAGNFGTISQWGDFTGGGSIGKQVNNEGTITLTDLGFTEMSKIDNGKLQSSEPWKNLFSGTGSVTFQDVNLTGFYSLDYLVNGVHDEEVMAGNLGSGYNVSFHGIVKNTESSSSSASTIGNNATLTLTGQNTENVIYASDAGDGLTNLGTLTLGHKDVESAIFNGSLITADTGTTNVLSHTTFIGNITSEGTTTFNKGATLNNSLNIMGGTTTFYNGTTLNSDLNIMDGITTFKGDGIVNGGTTVNGGSLVVDGTLDVSGGTLVVNKDATKFSTSENGKLIANASDFGIFSEDGSFIKSDNGIKELDNMGNLTLKGLTFNTIPKGLYESLLEGALTLTGSTGTITFDSVDMSDVYSLSTVVGAYANGALSAGTLSGNKTVETSHISASGSITDSCIEDGSKLTITGKTADALLTAGNITNKGTLTLGYADIERATLDGNLTTTSTGTTNIISSVNVTGNTSVSSGTLSIANGATYITNDFRLGGGDLLVGETAQSSVGGSFIASGETSLLGGTAFFDPAWTDGVGIEGASSGVFTEFANNIVDGNIIAGQNSYVVIGDSNTDLAKDSFANSGLTWGENGITAALFINSPVNLNSANGTIIVDGSATSSSAQTSNSATFAANSLFTVNVNDVEEGTAILRATDGSLSVDNNAKLLITGGSDSQNITIVNGFTGGDNSASTGWGIANKSNNIIIDSSLLEVENTLYNNELGSYTVSLRQLSSNNLYLSAESNKLLEEVQTKYSSEVDHENSGISFLNRIISSSYLGDSSDSVKAKELVSAYQLAGLGATNAIGFDMANTIGNIVHNNSLAFNLNSAQGSKSMSVWLAPLSEFSSVDGMETGKFKVGYNSTVLGSLIGFDYMLPVNVRLGVAASVGMGNAESTGGLNLTKNDFNFWGASVFAAYINDTIGLSLDFGYNGFGSNINQKTNALMDWGNNTADVTTNIINAGFNAEYIFNTAYVNIVPHAGVQYTMGNTSSYDVHGNDGTIADIASDNQHIVSFPVGVSAKKDFVTVSGVRISPNADIELVATVGDLNATSNASVSGLTTVASYNMKNVDTFSFNGGLGFEVAKDSFSFNVNYELEASEHEMTHGVHANVRYAF